jgi:hypothetical protein
LVFFIDKCLGLHVVPDALRARGERVELLTDHFAQDAPDQDWLSEVGRRGWIILSKDKILRHNNLEIVELLRSGTHSFILTSGNSTAQENAAALVAALPTMKRMVGKFTPPFVGTVSKLGGVKVHWTFDKLIGRVTTLPSAARKPKRS